MKNTITPLIPCWVHSLSDYRRMFDLQDQDLKRATLDYPASVSSFNAEMHALGFNQIVSADPQYDLKPLDMSKYVDQIIQQLAAQLNKYTNRIQPEKGKTLEDILNAWNYYAKLFASDYSVGKTQGRYQLAHLPRLPFEDFQFELALCPDLLLRETHASPDQVMIELCRVAHEVRIFPLLDEHGEISSTLGPAMLALQNKNYGIEVREVPYKLLKGNNAMLRVWAKSCVVSK
jgi:hypothetical protein